MRGYFYRIVTGKQGGVLAAVIKPALFLLSLPTGLLFVF
jgi:hypothetical protein